MAIAVRLLASLGVVAMTLLKILTRTRRVVMRSPILAGYDVGGIRKLTQEVTTNIPDGIYEANVLVYYREKIKISHLILDRVSKVNILVYP